MTPEKLKKVLAEVLRDFSPWEAPSDYYKGVRVSISERQADALPPFSIFLALVTFSNFSYFGRSEKVAWSIPISFKGVRYAIAHQKFGLSIYAVDANRTSKDLEMELADRLSHAVRISDGLIKPLAEAQIRAGNVTIRNEGWLYRGRYEFFRAKAEKCYSLQRSQSDDPIVTLNRKLRSDREGFFFASVSLDAYFSYLEHLLVLLLAFADFKPQEDNLAEFITSFWTEKFKRVFDLGSDTRAEQVYHSLLRVKERFRNPLSHGGFDRNGGTLYFHVRGLGAVPASLSRYRETIHYGFNPIVSTSFQETCAALDEADAFFATGSLRLAVRCATSPVDIAFNESSLRTYSQAMQSDGAMEKFIVRLLVSELTCHERYD